MTLCLNVTNHFRPVTWFRHFSTLRSQHSVYVKHEFHEIIQWNAPNKYLPWHPQRSCDLKPYEKLDPTMLQLKYRPFADRINELPEDERRLFTVSIAGRRETRNVIMVDTTALVQRHQYDWSSPEFMVAKWTVKIRNFQDLFEYNKKFCRGQNKSSCHDLIQKRHKYLTILKNQDIKRFEWVLQLLGLLYRPLPEVHERLIRKECLLKLTNMYCHAMKSKHLLDYKVELESQKIPFLEEKLATLKQIKADEDSMRLPCSVEVEIAETVERIETLKKNPAEIKAVEEMELHPSYHVPDTLYYVGETKTSVQY